MGVGAVYVARLKKSEEKRMFSQARILRRPDTSLSEIEQKFFVFCPNFRKGG